MSLDNSGASAASIAWRWWPLSIIQAAADQFAKLAASTLKYYLAFSSEHAHKRSFCSSTCQCLAHDADHLASRSGSSCVGVGVIPIDEDINP
jgi:hypothetical protein